MKAIHEVQQKTGFKNLLLEKKLTAIADTLEKKEAQLNEVLSASNLDPSALTMVTRKLEVCMYPLYGTSLYSNLSLCVFECVYVVFVRCVCVFELVYYIRTYFVTGRTRLQEQCY